ncbi:3-oxoacyl-[acyl-carrier-protein] reductase [compost metagenome]
MQSNEKVALVTGASSGLGVALAKELAGRGYDLVLTARSERPMAALAQELSSKHGVKVWVEALDLSEPRSAAELVARLDAQQINPSVLVNNAGFGLSEQFVSHAAVRLRSMLQLNVISLTELTHILGARMVARGSGHILLVASLAAYAPSPKLAAYAASKAYILSLGEALNVEMAPSVGVTVLSPGVMDTGFNAASGYEIGQALRRFVRPTAMVAAIGIDALFAGKPSIVAGRLNRLLLIAGRLLPRSLVLRQLRKAANRKH